MPQSTKGARQYVPVRLPIALDIDSLSKAAGYDHRERSQYIADVMAIHAGRPELVVGPRTKNREEAPTLPLTA